jgi:hypothetical protein
MSSRVSDSAKAPAAEMCFRQRRPVEGGGRHAAGSLVEVRFDGRV